MLTVLFLTIILSLLGSRVKTGFTPLSKVKKAAVLLCGDDPDYQQTADDVQKFFDAYGIAVQIVAVRRGHLIKVRRKVDLFISLLPVNGFKAEYVARRSKALFKVGRYQMRKETFDLVVSDPEGRRYPQREVFSTISKIISQTK
ncbi:MAG: hypothetical protein J5771_05125 [Bacteroidales bacterium]|nr:hypothetical protein [Bacteroidales bacterium]